MNKNHVKQAFCFLVAGFLLTVFISACSKSASPTTPTSSSSSGDQLYVLALESNGGSGITMVGIKGPYSNASSTSYSFSLPSAPGGTQYVIVGLLDVADGFIVPSGPQSIVPPASDFAQFYASGCVSGGSPSQTFTASQSSLALVMDSANSACTFGSGQSIYYSPTTGSSVVLSGTISESGL
jgi:hypothetical protein